MPDLGTKQVQLLVIGAGVGGYTAAFRGRRPRHQSDDGRCRSATGGRLSESRLHPVQGAVACRQAVHEVKEAANFGVTFGERNLDLDKLRSFVQKSVVGRLDRRREYADSRLGASNISRPKRHLKIRETVSLSGEIDRKIQFEHCIVATGSVPAMPKVFNIGDPRVMDSTGALLLPDVPKRLLVIGGGYIGLEIGQVYAALGSKVTVVEALDGILMQADRDLVKPLEDRLKKDFENIFVSTKVLSLTAKDPALSRRWKERRARRGRIRPGSGCGRPPGRIAPGFGLDKTKVEIDERGFIKVDAQRRTHDPHIFCVGDVAGDPGLAHKATAEAKVAVETILGEPAEYARGRFRP